MSWGASKGEEWGLVPEPFAGGLCAEIYAAADLPHQSGDRWSYLRPYEFENNRLLLSVIPDPP